jgi:hypothetical protein
MSEAKSSLIVVESVYYQIHNEQPSTAFGDTSRFICELSTDEQAYQRKQVVGETWVPLKLGWLENCSQLLLKNEEGKFAYNPTEEQKQAVASRVIQLSFTQENPTAHVLIPPGENSRFRPYSAQGLMLRCECGNAQYTIYAVPG